MAGPAGAKAREGKDLGHGVSGGKGFRVGWSN